MLPQTKYYLALAQKKENGSRTIAKLIHQFGSAKAAWQATATEINPDEEVKKVKKFELDVFTLEDENYPKLLREIPDAPAILFVKGKILPEDEIAVAVVGSRKYSDYGRMACQDIAFNLAKAGVTVVSGLALGIDGFAHLAALDAGGRTIAVLANGLDQIYPRSNTTLAWRIIQKNAGAIISEFPIGTPSYPSNFPIRNRIIAGISKGVVIVEGSQKSGTLLTAQSALDYNREVFAVPGPIYSQTSAAPNNLIKIGAKLVNAAEDIISELNLDNAKVFRRNRQVIADNTSEALILPLLGKDPIHIDKIAALSKLDITVVTSALVLMEMKGKVRNIGGNLYIIS